jgi:DNA processing protein
MDGAQPRYLTREEVFASRPALATKQRFDGLWVTGSLAGLERRTVALVGTRAPSAAGRALAHRMACELARAGLCVVSGLALGIDGAAHAGALEGGAPTIGVLGGGHHHFYPPRNRGLAERMLAAGGAVLSPFAPGEPARPWQFLQRNAIVAALADAVVVVEAAERSGALNTAGWAGDLCIGVYAVPGDVDRPKAAGCNALIRDGATLVRHAADVLAELGIKRAAAEAAAPDQGRRLKDPFVGSLAAALAAGPRDVDGLACELQATPGRVLAALVQLELEGLVERREAATFARRPREA